MVIYQIRNIVNNKIYVGSSSIFEKRKTRHIYELRNGNHHSSKLQRSFNKYGEESFIFEILETLNSNSKDELLEKEQEYLDKLKPELNGWHFAKIPLNHQFCKEWKKAWKKGVQKKITQYDLGGHKIADWNSIKECGEALGISANQISGCCQGLKKTAKGFRFSYMGQPIVYKRKSRARYTPIQRKKSWSKHSANTKYNVTHEGKTIEIVNLKKFCEGIDISVSSAYNVINGKQKSTKGYIFSRAKK